VVCVSPGEFIRAVLSRGFWRCSLPYKSAAQRAYLHIHEPKVAAEWDKKYGGGGKDLPQHVKGSEAGKKSVKVGVKKKGK
jgi:hypothetical protein